MRKIVFVCGVVLGLAGGTAGAAGKKEAFFEFKGKTYSASELPLEIQTHVFEVEKEYYDRLNQLVEAAAMETYFATEAKKKNRSAEEIEKEMLISKTPTDDEVKAWYEKNKDKISQPLDKVKPNIVQMLMAEKQKEKRNEILAKVKGIKGPSAFANLSKPPKKPTATDKVVLAKVDPSVPLYKFMGKTYKAGDLSSAMQQGLFDLQHDRYERLRQMADSASIDFFLDGEAQAKKKTKADLEKELLGTNPPTDAEIKAWYDQNKERVPYPFDKVKDQIGQFLTAQKKKEKRDQLLAMVKKDFATKLVIAEPQAPHMKIAVDGFASKGNPSGPVTMVEFADYRCGHCKHAAKIVDKVVEAYKDKVRFVFIDFPLQAAGVSTAVAEGGVCAREQDKYWDYHDKAFERENLSEESPFELAKELKLNDAKFKECMASEKTKSLIKRGRAEGEKIGLSGTPTIYVNGKRVNGYQEELLIAAIKEGLEQKK